MLFAGGAAVGLTVAGHVGYALWEARQEEQADRTKARRDCVGRFDPEEWGTPRQQFDGCVSERMEGWVWQGPAYPILFVFIAAPWLAYMGITGLIALLARDYQRDQSKPFASGRHPLCRPGDTTVVMRVERHMSAPYDPLRR